MKNHIVIHKYGKHKFSLHVGGGGKGYINLGEFNQIIRTAMRDRKKQIEEEKKRVLTIDFSFLKEYMEKGGITMQSITCPSCKAPLKVPEAESQVKCEYCGSMVYAHDIFKKIKELIG